VKLLSIVREDVRLVFRDKSAIFWLFVAPFLWIYFFGQLAGGGDGSQTRIGLTVADHDGTELSRRFIDLLGAENFSVNTAQGTEDEENAARILILPAGFEEAIRARKKVPLTLREKKGASPDGTFAAQVAVHKASVRLLSGEVFGEMAPDKDLIAIRSSWAGALKVPSGYYQTVPGYLVMFVTLQALTMGAARLAKDRRSGLLSRLAVSPLTRAEIVAGKLAARGTTALLQAGVLVIAGLTVFKIDWGSSPLGLAAVILSLTFAISGISLLSGTLFKSPDGAAGIGVVLALIMSALGGCWWPAEVMPRWLRTASHALPTAWAMDAFHQIISWGGGLADVAVACAVLMAFGLASMGLAVRRLRFGV